MKKEPSLLFEITEVASPGHSDMDINSKIPSPQVLVEPPKGEMSAKQQIRDTQLLYEAKRAPEKSSSIFREVLQTHTSRSLSSDNSPSVSPEPT